MEEENNDNEYDEKEGSDTGTARPTQICRTSVDEGGDSPAFCSVSAQRCLPFWGRVYFWRPTYLLSPV